MTQSVKKIFSVIALVGLIISLIVHSLALAGINVGEEIPFIWALHVGIFIVWFPAMITLIQNKEMKAIKKQGFRDPFAIWRIAFKGIPSYVTIVFVVFFVYAFFNFMLFMSESYGGVSAIIDGKMVLHNHGNIIKELTQEEYSALKANELRGFSGHWMAFYCAAILFLWPKSDSENV